MEAIRLNGICKTFKENIDQLSFRNKLLNDELNTLKTKWKESENINKQLLFELESNIQSNKEMEEELNKTKSMINKNNIKIDISNSNLIGSKINLERSKSNYYIESEGNHIDRMSQDSNKKNNEINSLNEKIKRYKSEAKLSKEKAQKALTELNKYYLGKNKLENIFNDCVNATKKIIYNRKLKENKSYKIKNKTGLGKYDYKIYLTTKYEEFLPKDKQNTLENFLFNEEVYNFVKDAIFKHPHENKKKNENIKKSMSEYNFYDTDWKMKEVIENASSELPKKNSFLPLMSVGNQIKNIKMQKEKLNNQFCKTGKIRIMSPFVVKKQQLGTSSKLTMNLQI